MMMMIWERSRRGVELSFRYYSLPHSIGKKRIGKEIDRREVVDEPVNESMYHSYRSREGGNGLTFLYHMGRDSSSFRPRFDSVANKPQTGSPPLPSSFFLSSSIG
jgi:hypothetical protein